MLLCAAFPALAQVELSGTWTSKNHEDALERGAGPNPVDFTGIPFNESGRAKSLSYVQSQISMPERICAFYSQWHLMVGTFGMKIWNVPDPLKGGTIAWVVGAWEDRAPMTIWMDGRPHPSKNAPHSQAGFTTGTWDGDVLTAYSTHMLTGYLRKNGVPYSENAAITEYYDMIKERTGDVMLVVTETVTDPQYLREPFIITSHFKKQANDAGWKPTPCSVRW